MSNFVLDFLKNQVQPFVATGTNVANDISAPAREAANWLTTHTPGNQTAVNLPTPGQTVSQIPIANQMTDNGSLRNQASDIAQVGVSVLAPEIARPAEKLALPFLRPIAQAGEDVAGRAFQGASEAVQGAARQIGRKVAGGAAKGVVGGATVGAAGGAAGAISSAKNPGDLAMDFLRGGIQGAEQGGVFGAASAKGSGVGNEATAVGGPIGNLANRLTRSGNPAHIIDDETANDLAHTEDPKQVQKKLEDAVGPVVSQDVAGAVASSKDPGTIQQIVDNDVQNKLPSQPAAQTPLPPETNMSDVNTSQQVAAQAAVQPMSSEEFGSLSQAGSQLSPRDIREQAPETQPKPFINAPGEAGNSHVSTLAARTDVYELLNSGAPVDAAIQHYMEKTSSSFVDAQKAVNDVLNNSNIDRGNVNMSKNPRFEEGANFLQHEVGQGDTEGPVKNAQTVHNAVMREGNKALQEVDKLSSADVKLMDDLRTTDPQTLAKQAENPAQFLRAAEATKSYNDLTQAVGAGHLGQQVPYRENYGAPLLLDNTPEGQEATQAAMAKLKTTPGYSKGRFFKDYDEAQNFGAQRQFENFRDDLAYDVQRRANDLSQLTLSKGLNEAFPGKVNIGTIGSSQEGTYKQLLIPGGNKISMPSDIADKINARAPAPQATGALKGYDTLNAGLKNLKLGGGGFHAINVAGTYIGHQLLSGQAFKHPEQIGEMVKNTFSSSSMDTFTKQMDDAGYLKAFDQMGLKYGEAETAADVNPEGKLANIPVLSQLHHAIFGRQIPYMKMRVLQQWMDDRHIDPNNLSKEEIQAGTKIAKEVNQNYGGINRAIQGLTPRTFKLASRGLLATDYTEGQLRTLVDAFTQGGDAGRMAREIVAGKALLFAGLATVGGLAGGEFKGKNPEEVAKDIISKTINPEFQMGGYNVSLPETQLSEFAKPIAQGIGNAATGKKPLAPLENFATARLAALPSEAFQLANNKDFYDNPIYGSDYYGRPISAADTALNLASGVTPVPGSQAIQAAQGNESPEAAIANTAGLKASPINNLQYASVEGQTYVDLLKQNGAPKEQINADTQFFDTLESLSKQRSKALTSAESAIAKGNSQKAQTDVNAYSQQLIKELQPWVQGGGTKYMDTTMMSILRSNMLTLGTASKYERSDVKTNPTRYGLPLSASSLNTDAQLAAQGQTSNTVPV